MQRYNTLTFLAIHWLLFETQLGLFIDINQIKSSLFVILIQIIADFLSFCHTFAAETLQCDNRTLIFLNIKA